MIAYHVTGNKLRDGRAVPAIGEKLVHSGPLELGKSGLHAGVHVLDALLANVMNNRENLSYLHRVECGGEIISADASEIEIYNWFVCRERTILGTINPNDLINRVNRKYALDVADLWDAPGAVVEYLRTGQGFDAAWDCCYRLNLTKMLHTVEFFAIGAACGALISAKDYEFLEWRKSPNQYLNYHWFPDGVLFDAWAVPIRAMVARHMAGDDNIDSYSSVLWVQENSLGEINKYVDDIAEAEFAKVAQQG